MNIGEIFFRQAKQKTQAIIGLLPSIFVKHYGKRATGICAGKVKRSLQKRKEDAREKVTAGNDSAAVFLYSACVFIQGEGN
ncbi:MAG: hypothetical protein IKH13_09025 [Clostridia bacterium]|nr:hypothetical protein [Clostridia bacterium]